jgi:TorA maturation chaperone TorD
MSPEVPVTVALRRSALYRLLAMAFAYPTAARLAEVAAASPAGADQTPTELSTLQRSLAQAAGEADPVGLAGEHVTLFQRQVHCPPHEGAYGPPQLAGKAPLLADIGGFYRAFALEPAEDQPEVEDHVCTELEFMSALAFKEAWAIAESHAEGLEITHQAQCAFLDQHLARWGRTFAARVASTASPGFYPAAAALLTAWLDAECVRLDVVPARLEEVIEAEAAAFTCPMAPAE